MNRGTWLGKETLQQLPGSGGYARLRRRPVETRPAKKAWPRPEQTAPFFTSGYEPAEQILADILSSAVDVTGSVQGFILVSREGSVLEVAGTRNLRPSEVIDIVLARAAAPLHAALRENRPAAADEQGHLLSLFEKPAGAAAALAAVLCVPLDLGLRQTGALCLMRQACARRVSELDLEIVQALAEQAALAIGAACHQTALTRLEASLSSLAPLPA